MLVKIGIYSPYLDTVAGGEKYILTIAACLSKKHDVSLFWNKDDESALKKTIHSKFGLDLSHIPFVDNIFSSDTTFLARLQQSRTYDSIIFLSDGSIPVVSSRLILHFQTPMPWIHPSIKTRIKLRRVSHIVCNSLYTKKYIDKEFGVNSEVIYPPVTIQKQSKKKENIILHVGRFGIENEGSSAKKQEFMADTFKKMVDKGESQNWELIFVISYKDKVQEAVKVFKRSIQNYPITLIENPTNELLWNMYNKAKIYWHASGFGEDIEKNPGRAEHFGISTVEAMGVGAVPIVINVGGQPEIVEDAKNGLLWNTQDELIEKTKEVMKNTDMWQKLSDEAQKKATAFDENTFCTLWEKLIL